MAPPAASRERIHYVDWLRVIIVYGIALYHVALVFSVTSWLVSNRDQSLALGIFTGFTFTWGIPAMFLIAGAGSWLAFQKETWQQFVRSRMLRLFIPMIVGIALLTPLQRYFVASNPPGPISDLPGYYSAFARSVRLDEAPQWLLLYGLHLWFLGYLFAISLACLPVLRWLRDAGRGHRLLDRLRHLAMHRGALVVFGAPLILSQALLRHSVTQYQGWADVGTYIGVFLLGAVLLSDRRFEAAIRHNTVVVLPVALVAALSLGMLVLQQQHVGGGPSQPPPSGWVFGALWGLNTWCWLVLLLDLGVRWLDRPSRAVRWANDSTLPFYVLHHPVVVGVASFVVTWNTGIWVKFPVLLISVYAITLLLYEICIRRFPPLRLAFGLAPRAAGDRSAISRRARARPRAGAPRSAV